MSSLITVWTIPLSVSDEALVQLQALLSDEENANAARFINEVHRRRYIVSHGAMRQILSRETGCTPDKLRFVQTRFGKPALEDPFAHVQFNLAHSADIALLAVSQSGAVGVDIEAQRPLADLGELVTQVCSPAEAKLVMSSADAEQMFYRCWVGKEAALKCLGWGLNLSMKDFDVLDTRGHLMASPVLPPAWLDVGSVALHLLDILPQGFAGAIAIQQNAQEDRTNISLLGQNWQP